MTDIQQKMIVDNFEKQNNTNSIYKETFDNYNIKYLQEQNNTNNTYKIEWLNSGYFK